MNFDSASFSCIQKWPRISAESPDGFIASRARQPSLKKKETQPFLAIEEPSHPTNRRHKKLLQFQTCQQSAEPPRRRANDPPNFPKDLLSLLAPAGCSLPLENYKRNTFIPGRVQARAGPADAAAAKKDDERRRKDPAARMEQRTWSRIRERARRLREPR